MPVTPVFGWPYPELGNEANVPSDIEKLAEAIENILKALEPKYLKTAGAGDAKKLLIVQNTGQAAFKALSGDATISEAGALTIANEAVNTVKLAALSVTEAKVAALAITTAKIANLAVTDEKLASPNNSVYRTLLQTKGFLANGDITGAKYLLGSIAVKNGRMLGVGAGNINMAEEFTHAPPDIVDFASADYAVASKTQKMRLRAGVMVGGNTVATVLTFNLYPITPAGGSKVYEPTLGAAVTGSTATITNPAALSKTLANSGDFTIPADGLYVVGVTISANIGEAPVMHVVGALQHRNV
jgi:hypothetical protein